MRKLVVLTAFVMMLGISLTAQEPSRPREGWEGYATFYFKHDLRGDVSSMEIIYTEGDIYVRDEYAFNERGDVTLWKSNNRTRCITSRVATYDYTANRVGVKSYDEGVLTDEYTTNIGEDAYADRDEKILYDDTGRILERSYVDWLDYNVVESYAYTDGGHIVTKRYGSYVEYIDYNKSGRRVKQQCYKDEKLVYSEELKYNTKNLLVESRCEEDSVVNVTTYEYDSKGQRVLEIKTENGQEVSRYTYTYDARGNIVEFTEFPGRYTGNQARTIYKITYR